MKKITMMLFLFTGIGFYASAQTTKPAATKMPKALVAMLQPTADQQTKIDAIMQAKAARIDSLMAADPQLADKASKKAKRRINTEAEVKIDNVLTDDQRKKYTEFKDMRKEKTKAKLEAAKDVAAKPVIPPPAN